ncbi:MAG: hypothetical protein ACJAR2_001315 [Ilumatobacter sp.]|jgi:hypothetical protein
MHHEDVTGPPLRSSKICTTNDTPLRPIESTLQSCPANRFIISDGLEAEPASIDPPSATAFASASE